MADVEIYGNPDFVADYVEGADPAPAAIPDERGEWRRGWGIVAGAMVGIGTGPGLYQNLSSLFTPGMLHDFGWTRGDIATAAGLGLIGGLAAPFLGRLADRVGVRVVIVTGMLLLAAAYAGMAAMTGALWQFRLLVALLALSVPGTSALVHGKLIASAFARHRGIALGIATSGLSLTTIALPPFVAAVIALYGWRSGFLALAVLTGVVALPLVLIAIRRVPSIPVPYHRADTPADVTPGWGFTGRQARATPSFWQLAAGVMFVNMATVGLVTQLVPFGIDHGLRPAQAALLLASYGASQISGRLVIGLLIDRFRPARVAACAALVSAIGFALLQVQAPGFVLLMGAVFLAGIMNGAEHDLLPFLTARLFGLRAYGEVYGSLLMLSLVGTAAGVVGFGRLHDLTGGYTIALTLALSAMLLAALTLFMLADRIAPPD